jgi:hypothetical protein
MAGLAKARISDRPTLEERVERVAWQGVEGQLDELGYATIGPPLSAEECRGVAEMYGEAARFRSRIVMRRHAFGAGEYQYFAYPLPELVAGLRELTYPRLVAIANRWQEALGLSQRYPEAIDAYLKACRAAGQKRPTPLLLKYGAGDDNRLHQDLYGELNFPLQMAILLSAPGRDFEGGEFVLAEQGPRTQLRA